MSYSEQVKEEIIKYYINNPNITLSQITEEFHVAKSTVYSWLNEANVDLKRLEYRPRKTTINLDNIKSETSSKYYWLGFLSADGNVSSNLLEVSIHLKSTDDYHIQNFLDFLGCNTSVKYFKNNSGADTAKGVVCSKELSSYLSQYNIVPNKSKIFTIPVKAIPKEFIYDYVRGLYDGDGCIMITKKDLPVFSFCSGNYECCKQVADILEIKNKICFSSGVWRIDTAGEKAKKIFNNLYKNSTEKDRLARRYNKYKTLN